MEALFHEGEGKKGGPYQEFRGGSTGYSLLVKNAKHNKKKEEGHGSSSYEITGEEKI